ncbi:MAG: TPM domain-containing protein, partial [Phycisphaerales bacterium]
MRRCERGHPFQLRAPSHADGEPRAFARADAPAQRQLRSACIDVTDTRQPRAIAPDPRTRRTARAEARGSLVGCVVAVDLLLASAALARIDVPRPPDHVHVADRASIIDASTERQMNVWLDELYGKTKEIVFVLTVPTTEGEPFFDFVQRTARAWNAETEGKGISALICVAVKERQARIHTSY